MKRINYTPGLSDAFRDKTRGSAGAVQGKNIPTQKPLRVPIDVIAEQVSASMAIEGRALASKLTVKPTPASKQLVVRVAARSAERRRKSEGMPSE